MKRTGRSFRRALAFETLENRRVLAAVPNGFTETVVASDLTSPITMDIEESSGRIWLAFQDGRIQVIENDALLPAPAIQLDCDGSGERGLQGIELDPDFETTGYIYVYYTAARNQAGQLASHNRLSRLTVDPTTENTILPGSEVILLELPEFSTFPSNQNPIWHMGGAIHFLPDETLVVQVGDHLNRTLVQNNNTPLGKVLRVHKDGTPAHDNPFYNSADTNPPGGSDWSGNAPGDIDWIDYVWASGLRNPFSGDVDRVTGRYFVGDVGEGSWEEINDATAAGRNFGWPQTEGAFNPASFPNFTNPVHAYSHTGGNCAITGGAFYSGVASQFPAQYDGKFFFSEFCGGEIRVIDPDNPAAGVQVFASDAAFPMNIEFASNGSMYYISRGAGAGGAPGIGTGTVRKVQYTADVPPQIVLNPTDQLASIGQDATFTASAAGTTPLAYQWQRHNGTSFVDIPGAVAASLTVPNVSLTDNGAQFRVVVTNGFGMATSPSATLSVTSDTPPTPVINLPPTGLTYRAGDAIVFSGSASDLEDGAMPASALSWKVDFHHNVHAHPVMPATSGITGGQFTIPTVTEKDHDVWYRITLSVTDSAGLTTATFRDVLPEKSEFVVETNMPGGGGEVLVDDLTTSAPHDVTGVVNVQRTIEAPNTQQVGGTLGFFDQWIDGVTTRARTISTPENDTAYVALYRGVSGAPVYLSDLPVVGAPVNGWGPMELDTSNGEAAAGDGNPITLNGVTYAKGLGVHALSEVVYNLAGGFNRFVSDIGVDDENAPGGSVVFRVFADNVEVFNSGLMTNASATQTVNVDVTGVSQLRLVVTDGGNGNGSDHADWADARLFADSGDPVVKVNFQLDAAPVPAGYLPDSGSVFGDRSNGWSYGWSSDHTDLDRDREVNTDQRLDTLVHFHQGQNWEIELPNGSYLVTASIGDAGFSSTHTLNVEGVTYWTGLPLAANQFANKTQLVTVTDGRLTLDQGAAAERATRINFIDIVEAGSESGLLPYDAADVTLDSHLNQTDLTAFMAGWEQQHGALPPGDLVRRGDLNFDRTTNLADWAIMEAAWNAEYGPGSAPNINHLIAALVGDFNHDGSVDGADLADQWKPGFGTSNGVIPVSGDADADGDADGADFLTWQRHVGESTSTSAGLTPDGSHDTGANLVAPADAEAARNALLAGVSNIAVSGSPGQIAVFDPPGAGAGQGAFGVIHDGDYRPMVAAAIWGSGKVVAFGHNGYVNFDAHGGTLDTGQFYRNSVSWTTNSAGLSAAIVTNVSSTRTWLLSQGYTNVTLRSDWQNGLTGANLLIAEIGPGTTTAQQNALRTFVMGGGGLITGGTGWGYQQLGSDLVTMSGNVILREAGLAWASGFRNGTTNATRRSTELANASQALSFAQQLWAGGSGTAAQREEAGRTLQAVLTVLPGDHPLYIEITAAFSARAAAISATPATPVSDALDQAVLTWESNMLAATPVAQVTAHHTADDVYGVIPASAPRVTDVVTLHTVHHDNVTVNRWQATGLYAAPGEIVTVTVPASLVGRGYKIRVNAHADDISQRDAWERMPVVHRSFSINQTTTQIASAFGGSIFIDFGSGAVNVGDVPITIAGAVRQPYFVLGQHTNVDWNNSLRTNPAPYGVLVSENLIIVLPKHQIESANLTKPHELMTWWNEAVRLQDDLSDQAKFRRGPEIINVDVQNSAGAAHAGFPIQAYQKHWGNLADWDELQQNGSWGDFHELGHNHQRSWWTFDGDVEVGVNIFANYALESLTENPAGGWAWSADPVKVIQEAIQNVAGGGGYSSKSNRWSFWFQLADGFGWSAYDQVFAGYETDAATNPSALPTSNQQEKDQWFTRWSNAVGYDMKRFMVDVWGLEVSQAAINAVSALPDWMPLATTVDDFQVNAGQSRILNLAGGGLGMDGVATFVSAIQPQKGTLTDNGNGTFTYVPNVAGGTDSFAISYQSSAGNTQAFTVNVTIGNGFLPGDVDLDNDLDMADVTQFIAGWRSNTAGLSDDDKVRSGDLNLNGVTDLADFFILHQAWNAQGGASLDMAALMASETENSDISFEAAASEVVSPPPNPSAFISESVAPAATLVIPALGGWHPADGAFELAPTDEHRGPSPFRRQHSDPVEVLDRAFATLDRVAQQREPLAPLSLERANANESSTDVAIDDRIFQGDWVRRGVRTDNWRRR
jgi:glucose/arabinose dehydrogenase